MHINDALNLVVPIRDKELGSVSIRAFHVPISADVFDANFDLIANAKAYIDERGLYFQMGTAPLICARIIRKQARKDAELVGQLDPSGKPSEAAADALFAEIKRLTTILSPGHAGWESLPVDTAISRKAITPDEWQEVLSDLVFFTCHFAMARSRERTEKANAVAALLNGSVVLSPILEYIASLPQSTTVETSQPKAASSVPA